MWRFALTVEDASKCSRRQLLNHRIAEDWEFSHTVGSLDEGQIVYADEGGRPASVDEAVQFVRRVCGSSPRRVWLEGREVMLDDRIFEHAARSRQSNA